MVSESNRLIARRYELVRELGRGGMGVVWEGRDTLLNRQVAIKEVVLPDGLPAGDRERQLMRTVREARTAAKLNHPGVVAVYDVVEEGGRPWIVMELLSCPTVEQVVLSTGALPIREAADVGRQVLSALRAAHEAGILHRDVKPSNILMTEDGRAVLTDFGIATVEGDVSLTRTGMVTGSPSFLAPERVRADAAGPASDLWSLGATLYACLVGRSPFERGEAMATLNALLNEEPDYRRIPPAMHPVLRGLLQKEPEQRLSAEEADRLLTELAATSRPAYDDDADEPRRGRGGRGRTLLAAATVAVVVVGAGTFGYFRFATPAEGAPRASTAPAAATAPLTPVSTSATPTPSATPSARPSVTRAAAPLVRAWRSPDGWTILRPYGWRGARREAYTEWTRRDRNAHFGVQAVYSSTDPAELMITTRDELRQSAEDVVTRGRRTVDHQGVRALEWELTYTAGAEGGAPWVTPGARYRELRRAMVVGDTAYVLSWTVAEGQWARSQRLMRQVINSFTVRA
ncbi:serine/threonine-protein kinase [Nonomuraea bangladeshensis]|uniref:serine/threonine-protein kinase n=1 Tax=Nonomuraea bangladeshensis TaxID=404385 RepID=UPI003C309CA8